MNKLTWKPIESAPKDGTRILLYLAKHDIAVSGCWEYYEPEYLDGYPLYEYEGFYDWYIDNDIYIMGDTSEYATHWCEFPDFKKQKTVNFSEIKYTEKFLEWLGICKME